MPNPYIGKGDKCKVTIGGQEYFVDQWEMAIVDAEKQKDANIGVDLAAAGKEATIIGTWEMNNMVFNAEAKKKFYEACLSANRLRWDFGHCNPERKETMPVFEVVIIEEPSKNAKDDGELEKLILGPVTVVAKDKESAGTVVAMENADKLKDVVKTRMKVLCRPFC